MENITHTPGVLRESKSIFMATLLQVRVLVMPHNFLANKPSPLSVPDDQEQLPPMIAISVAGNYSRSFMEINN